MNRDTCSTLSIIVLLLAAGGFAVATQSARQKLIEAETIRTQHLEIASSDGKVVYRIQPMGEGYPGLAITFGDNSKAIASLMNTPDGSVFLELQDQETTATAGLMVGANGVCSMGISRYNGKGQVSFGLDDRGVPYWKMVNPDGTVSKGPNAGDVAVDR